MPLPLVRIFAPVAVGLLLPGIAARAQIADSVTDARTGRTSSEVWIGYSPASTTAGVLGRHGGISLGLIGMRWNRRIGGSDAGFVYYTMDLIPVAHVTPLIDYTDAADRCGGPYYDCLRTATIARGVGFSPVGVTVIKRAEHAVQWRLGANGGVLIFDRRTPSDLASRFNFTAALEGGVQIVTGNGSGILLVYRLHHLSNAGMAQDNLALLSHVVSIGARWRLRR